MYNPNEKITIRWPLDVKRHLHQGQQILILSCPLGIIETPVIINALLAPVLAEFDGTLTNEEILNKFEKQGLSLEVFKELVELLDSNFCLLNDNFREYLTNLKERFHNSTVRESALKGISFPHEKEALEKEINTYLALEKDDRKNTSEDNKAKKLLALIAPHIDYRRGGVSYGKAYRHLIGQEHDLYILIGTAHQYSPFMFHLTKKDFVSPLGKLACDNELVSEIAKKHGEKRSFADELLHKREHSLELQLPFMHHIKNNSNFIPILVGGMYNLLNKGISPNDHEEYRSFKDSLIDSLREKYLSKGKSICFIAGVDMAHIGQSFGDREKLSKDFLKEVEIRDEKYLTHVLNQNKDKLFSHIAEDNDKRRICGYPTLYLVLDVLENLGLTNLNSKLFDYSQAVDLETDCAVTFASAGLYEN